MSVEAQTVNYMIRFTGDMKNVNTLIKSFENLATTTDGVTYKAKEVNKSLHKTGATLSSLAKRSLLVIPIWMTLRSVYTGLIGTVRQGFKAWQELDREMTRVRSTIQGTTTEIDSKMSQLSGAIEGLSYSTGKSLSKLTNSFYQFSTIGLGFEKSMSGMQAALTTTIAMQGDLTQVSKVMAQSYNLLNDTMDQNLSSFEQQQLMGAQLYRLYQDNAFEITEMAGAMSRFLPVANNMNVSYAEMIAMLAALHSGSLKAERGGRLLATSFGKFFENADKLPDILGTRIDPNQSAFENLDRIIGLIEKLNEYDQTIVLQKLFGGSRGSMPIRTLIALMDKYRNNVKATKGNVKALIETITSRKDEVLNTLDVQVKRFGTLRSLIGKSFLEGITGADNFVTALKKINNSMATLVPYMKKFGKTLQFLIDYQPTNLIAVDMGNKLRLEAKRHSELHTSIKKTTEGYETLNKTIKNINLLDKAAEFSKLRDSLSVNLHKPSRGVDDSIVLMKQLIETKKKIKKIKEDVNFKDIKDLADFYSIDTLNRMSYTAQTKLPKLTEEQKAINKGTAFSLYDEKEIKKQQKKLEEIQKKAKKVEKVKGGSEVLILPRELKQKINLREKELEVIRAQATTLNDIEASERTLNDYLKSQVDYYNGMEATMKHGSQINQEYFNNLVKNKDWETLYQLMKHLNDSGDKVAEIQAKTKELEEKRLSIVKEYNDAMNETVSGGISGMLKGEVTPKEALTTTTDFFKNSMIDAFSGALTDQLLASTGLSEVFGDFMTQLRYKNPLTKGIATALNDGGKKVHDYIVSAFTGVISTGSNISGMNTGQLSNGIASGDVGGIIGGIGGLVGGLGTVFGGGGSNSKSVQEAHYARMFAPSYAKGGDMSSVIQSPMGGGISGLGTLGGLATLGGMLFPKNKATDLMSHEHFAKSYGGKAPKQGITANQVGGALMAGATAFSTYQGTRAGGHSAGYSGAAAGLAGIGSIMMMVPGLQIPGALMAIGGMVMGAIPGKAKKKVERRYEESWGQVASKVEITNKKLDVVNRNLVAIRDEKTFLLPNSYYFSEEDKLAINIKR